MTDLNDVKLIGRITRDSVLERTAEIVYAKFSIAVNKDVKTPNGNYESVPAYIDLAIFDNYAEKMYTYLRKGTLIFVEGSLKPRQWSKDDVKINTLGVSVKKRFSFFLLQNLLQVQNPLQVKHLLKIQALSVLLFRTI